MAPLVSLILPYWMRQKAADNGLMTIDFAYGGEDWLEVIIVDDGSEVPFVEPTHRLNLSVITLPTKKEPKSPCVPWNEGVAAAKGEFVAISCVEILHTPEGCLLQLVEEVQRAGRDAFALAASWCPEYHEWHCHSTRRIPDCPPGTGLSFLGVMRKGWYDEIGGYDPIFRDGAGYEDRDFINRAYSLGTKFIIRDDLVTIHPKTDAKISWGRENFRHNEKIFIDRWSKKYA